MPESDPEPTFVAIARDSSLSDAYRRATETIDDFKAHLRIEDDRLCSLKLRFRDPDESDLIGEDQFVFMWLGSARYHDDEDIFSAEFFELPKEFQKWHHVGERLGFEADDIFDWMVNDDGRLYGGFTLRVAREQTPEEERAQYDSYVGVSNYEESTSPTLTQAEAGARQPATATESKSEGEKKPKPESEGPSQ